ncbi:MAG: 3-deoxy-manno-octulosonate cytidylyltransferase [Bacteroidales bacterium]
MKVIAIIPARYASTRFPGKPLVEIGDKSMINRVYEQVSRCVSVDGIYVATDDVRIADHVKHFGGNVCMTSCALPNGTIRCWEAYSQIVKQIGMVDVILNVQGDEPCIAPQALFSLISCFEDMQVQIATLVKKIDTQAELLDPNVVKVVRNQKKEALYFTRQTLPFLRDKELASWLEFADFYKHIGLYAYRPEVLSLLVRLPESELEKAEKLEQLRWLDHGFHILTKETNYESVSVDIPEDIDKIRKILGV